MPPLVVALLAVAAAPLAAQTAAPPSAPAKLKKVAAFDHQVTGVAVTENGRIFVNFPRWTEDTALSVGEVKDGKVVPYPDVEWNAWRNAKKDDVDAKNHWVCVQSIVADQRGSVWVIDPAAPAMGSVVKDGPKLVQIDLNTDRVVKVIPFTEKVAPQGSYLNDVRISPDGKTAYLTDSGAKGALVVVDIASGKATRMLDGDPSTQPDKSITVTYDGRPMRRPDGRGVEFAADGIALSRDGATLYWQAIKGSTLYSIDTASLTGGQNGDVASRVRRVANNGPADGLLISRHDGTMYVTSPQDDAIRQRDPTQVNGKLTLVVQDKRLRWPDTFAEGPDGTIYVTTSHIQDSAFFKSTAPAALPTELWSLGR